MLFIYHITKAKMITPKQRKRKEGQEKESLRHATNVGLEKTSVMEKSHLVQQ